LCKQGADQLAHDTVVVERRHDPAPAIATARAVMQECVSPEQIQQRWEVALKPDAHGRYAVGQLGRIWHGDLVRKLRERDMERVPGLEIGRLALILRGPLRASPLGCARDCLAA